MCIHDLPGVCIDLFRHIHTECCKLIKYLEILRQIPHTHVTAVYNCTEVYHPHINSNFCCKFCHNMSCWVYGMPIIRIHVHLYYTLTLQGSYHFMGFTAI